MSREKAESVLVEAIEHGNWREVESALPSIRDINEPVNFMGDELTLLGIALRCHATHIVEHLIRSGASLAHGNRMGETPLHEWALHNGDIHCLDLLLQYGADPDAPDYRGRRPLGLTLYFAGQHYSDYSLKDSVELLLRAGANPGSHDDRGYTPLHILAMKRGPFNSRVAELLIGAGVNIEAVSLNGRPLALAAREGNVSACEALVGYGADPTSACDPDVRIGLRSQLPTPLESAVIHGAGEVVRLFVEKFKVNPYTLDASGRELDQLTKEPEMLKLLKELKENYDPDEATPPTLPSAPSLG